MSKVIAEFPNKDQLSFAIDELKNYGLDRNDMIVSDGLEDTPTLDLKSESDDLKGSRFTDPRRLTIAVEVPKTNRDRVAAILREYGAQRVWWG